MLFLNYYYIFLFFAFFIDILYESNDEIILILSFFLNT